MTKSIENIAIIDDDWAISYNRKSLEVLGVGSSVFDRLSDDDDGATSACKCSPTCTA